LSFIDPYWTLAWHSKHAEKESNQKRKPAIVEASMPNTLSIAAKPTIVAK